MHLEAINTASIVGHTLKILFCRRGHCEIYGENDVDIPILGTH